MLCREDLKVNTHSRALFCLGFSFFFSICASWDCSATYLFIVFIHVPASVCLHIHAVVRWWWWKEDGVLQLHFQWISWSVFLFPFSSSLCWVAYGRVACQRLLSRLLPGRRFICIMHSMYLYVYTVDRGRQAGKQAGRQAGRQAAVCFFLCSPLSRRRRRKKRRNSNNFGYFAARHVMNARRLFLAAAMEMWRLVL